MARGAKIFGFRCIFGALLEMLLAGILLVATDGGSSTTDPSSDLPISPELGGVVGVRIGLPVLAGCSGRSEARRRHALLARRWRRYMHVEQLDDLPLVMDVGLIDLAIDREMAS